jgi:hypothetical protein
MDHAGLTMTVTMALVRGDSPRTRAIVTVIVMTITHPDGWLARLQRAPIAPQPVAASPSHPAPD